MVKFLMLYFSKIIGIILTIAITFISNLLIDNIIDKAINKKNKKNFTTLLMLVKRIKKVILYSVAILICLSMFETFSKFSTTLLSGLGIGSVVLGLAAQESLKNFFGSIGIVVGNPFEVGDFIDCIGNNISGTVEDITMRQTVIRTVDNRRIIIPNSTMNNYAVENYNYSENEVAKLVDYLIAYESDVDKAIEIIKEEMLKLYAPDPKGKNKNVEFPKVRVYAWKDSGIALRAWLWGKDTGDLYENYYKLNYNIKKRFEKAGIEIPYPHVSIVNKKN